MRTIGTLLAWLPATLAAAPVAVTADGTIAGIEKPHYIVYEGIPFAQPPTGALRWRPPAAVTPWQGTRQATAFRPMCMTSIPAIPGGDMDPVSEDCLYLNLWRPKSIPAGRKLPVMVYLYGGGFRAGSASFPLYWGQRLVQKGVITVNLSYRVGTFGFLSHPELSRESGHGTSGNYGVLDMIAGLEWVQRNIAAFGGDPTQVTIWGHSAGAFGVGYMTISPLARGLFARAIAQSGAHMEPLESPAVAEAEGLRWMKRLGVRSLDEMRALPAEQLESHDAEWPEDESGVVKGEGRSGSFVVLDGHVFAASMRDALTAGQQAQVPLLLGYNRDEDIGFGRSMWAWAQRQSAANPIFFYQFAYAPPGKPSDEPSIAGHGYELGYVFGHPEWVSPTRAGLREMELISGYWTRFAKTGDPNAPGRPPWPRFTPDHPVRMVLDERNRAAPVTDEEAARLQTRDPSAKRSP